MIDVKALFDFFNVRYVTEGKNVSSQNVGICCPFCGDDPSEHLLVSYATTTAGWWFCWRSSEHKGRTLHRLLSRLLSKSHIEINSILEEWEDGPAAAGMTALEEFSRLDPDHLFDSPQTVSKIDQYAPLWPSSFHPIDTSQQAKEYAAYLRYDRKFEELAIPIAQYYSLSYSVDEAWANRIIIPVFLYDKLLTWTGRSIGRSPLRYKTLKTRKWLPDSGTYEGDARSIRSLVYNADRLSKGKLLIINEGPFDVMKLDFIGAAYGIRATCIFGNQLGIEQLYALSDIALDFEHIVIGLDVKSSSDELMRWKLCEAVRPTGKLAPNPWLELPSGVGDAGDLTLSQAERVVEELLH